jgi:hypothetical protein
VYKENIRSERDKVSLGDVYFLFALVAFVVIDSFSFDLLLKTVVEGLGVLHSQREIIEILDSVLHFAAF